MVCNKSPQHSVAEDHNPLISQPWVLQDQWLWCICSHGAALLLALGLHVGWGSFTLCVFIVGADSGGRRDSFHNNARDSTKAQCHFYPTGQRKSNGQAQNQGVGWSPQWSRGWRIGASHARMCVLVAQLCPTLHDPMDSSPPGSLAYGNLQTRIPEWVPSSFSKCKFISPCKSIS